MNKSLQYFIGKLEVVPSNGHLLHYDDVGSKPVYHHPPDING